MEQILLVVQVIIAAALIAMVLLQRSDTDGFGMGSGGGGNLLSGRAKANLMTRTTAILATLFILNSLALSIMASRHTPDSIIDTIEAEEAKSAPAVPVDGKKVDRKDVKAEPAAKNVAPVVPNADETKPAPKPVVKKKPAADADTSENNEAAE